MKPVYITLNSWDEFAGICLPIPTYIQCNVFKRNGKKQVGGPELRVCNNLEPIVKFLVLITPSMTCKIFMYILVLSQSVLFDN